VHCPGAPAARCPPMPARPHPRSPVSRRQPRCPPAPAVTSHRMQEGSSKDIPQTIYPRATCNNRSVGLRASCATTSGSGEPNTRRCAARSARRQPQHAHHDEARGRPLLSVMLRRPVSHLGAHRPQTGPGGRVAGGDGEVMGPGLIPPQAAAAEGERAQWLRQAVGKRCGAEKGEVRGSSQTGAEQIRQASDGWRHTGASMDAWARLKPQLQCTPGAYACKSNADSWRSRSSRTVVIRMKKVSLPAASDETKRARPPTRL